MLTPQLENLLINQKLINAETDTLFSINNISWLQYEILLNKLDDIAKFRIKYCEGILTIMSPSRNHEILKKRIAILLEIYLIEHNINYYPTGSTTFRKEEKRGGLEPDKSYCFHELKEYPDLAIEVIFASIDSLQIYHKLGVKEVWFWQNEQLFIYHLCSENTLEFSSNYGYELIEYSKLFPNLNITIFTEYIKHPNPLIASKNFRQSFNLS
ncbi:MAG: Uma2 family endonuclease [Cyanobacterium sp. T60_A2020_053]|nr:Uma2 family endonuclease [Cyanobacterium sp. T60_A2020_053]